MERTIILPEFNKETILYSEVNLEDEGIIIVYDKGEIIGSVVYDCSKCNGYILNTIIDIVGYESLQEVLEANYNYTFKYITK